MKFDFLGLRFNAYTLTEALAACEHCITNDTSAGTSHAVFTPNAELIVRANKDASLRAIYNTTDIVTLDSWVVYYAARLLGKPVHEPVSAAKLMFRFLPIAAEKGYRIYLLGAMREVVETVVKTLRAIYPTISIVGWHDGYFDKQNPQNVVDDICATKPDVLFVAMSTPYKELFITQNKDVIRVPLCMGVGGSFDIIAGKCKHAPLWISKLGIEWLYRFVQEPRRLWKRYLVTNTAFLGLVIKEIIKNFTHTKEHTQ